MQWERWCFTSRGGPATYVTVMLKGQASKLMGQKTKPLKKKKKEPGKTKLVLFPLPDLYAEPIS